MTVFDLDELRDAIRAHGGGFEHAVTLVGRFGGGLLFRLVMGRRGSQQTVGFVLPEPSAEEWSYAGTAAESFAREAHRWLLEDVGMGCAVWAKRTEDPFGDGLDYFTVVPYGFD